MELVEVAVYAYCWRCGSRFNVAGGTVRERQLGALLYSTNPAKVYTDLYARALYTHAVKRYILHRRLTTRPTKEETPDENETRMEYNARKRQEQEREQQNKKELMALISPKAKERTALLRRSQLQSNAETWQQQKQFGYMPDDLKDKTFAELEIIIFGDASPEAHALDQQALKLESEATETV